MHVAPEMSHNLLTQYVERPMHHVDGLKSNLGFLARVLELRDTAPVPDFVQHAILRRVSFCRTSVATKNQPNQSP